MRSRIIERAAELEALEPAWWDLWRRSPGATPFQSPAWLIPWWRHFHPGELFTFAVHDGERLVGLAPCYIEDGAYGRRILPIGISASDYLDVLVDPDYADAAGEALVSRALQHATRWDNWELEELPPDAVALRLPVWTGINDEVARQSACPVLPLPPDEALGGVPAGKRRKLRHAHNRLSRRPHELFRVSAEEARSFLSELVRLHGARWQSRGEEGVLADGTVLAFQGDATERLAGAGLLRLYGLTVEGVLAGAYYGLLHRARAYYYIGGFDPAFSFESPGMILIGHAMAEASAEGVREYHFLRGQEAYKYEWGAVDRWNLRRSIRHAVAVAAHG